MSKLVATGLNGCIIKPSLPCPGGNPDNQYITKIFRKEKYDLEYKENIINKLKHIDPTEDYVIRPIPADEKCGEGEEAKIDIPSELINNCGPLQNSSSGFGFGGVERNNIRILYQKNAGDKTLADAIFEDMLKTPDLIITSPFPGRKPTVSRRVTYVPSEEINVYMERVMEIHDFLFDNNLWHDDIGFSNVMIDSEGKVRFIDTDMVKDMTGKIKNQIIEIVHKNLRESGIPQTQHQYAPFALTGFKFTKDDKIFTLFGGRKKTKRGKKYRKRIRKTLKRNRIQ